MNCIYCRMTATEGHHVIKRDKKKKAWGTDHPANIAPLCADCHGTIHRGTDIEKKEAILKKCYDYIRPNLDKCWYKDKAKYKPKIVRLIESNDL